MTASAKELAARWRLTQTNQPMSPPSALEQPRFGSDIPWGAGAAKFARSYAREPVKRRCRRERIQGRVARMLLAVLQHVNDCIADLPRAFQITPVPTVCPEAPAAAQQAVHAACDAHHQAAHS